MAKINQAISSLIKKKWLDPWIAKGGSQTGFADVCNVSERIIRKINSEENYRIPVETLEKICEGQGITLVKFFKLLEKHKK